MFNKTKNQEIFTSSDLSLVSAILSTKKAKLVSVLKVTPFKFEFQLTPLLPCLELKNEYINDKLIISAKAIAEKDFDFEKPAAIHAKFIPSLYGDSKMSSSKEGSIFLSDSKKDVESKIKKYAFSGGGATVKEHKEKGGNPDIDVSYQYLKIFFEENDDKLKKIYDDYKSGALLTSELKQILIEKLNKFLEEHQDKKEKAKDEINDFILED